MKPHNPTDLSTHTHTLFINPSSLFQAQLDTTSGLASLTLANLSNTAQASMLTSELIKTKCFSVHVVSESCLPCSKRQTGYFQEVSGYPVATDCNYPPRLISRCCTGSQESTPAPQQPCCFPSPNIHQQPPLTFPFLRYLSKVNRFSPSLLIHLNPRNREGGRKKPQSDRNRPLSCGL